MRKPSALIILSLLTLLLISCTTTKPTNSTSTLNGRMLTLGDTKVTSGELGGIESWQCSDNEYTSKVLVELGFFKDPSYSGIGFILYDGTNTGDETDYKRNGLDHRWNWGENESHFSFVIKPNGDGFYYDFTGVPAGEEISAKDVYHCRKR